MITNFALSLSFDGIELLHRVPRGWRRVGQVDVSSNTLDEDLSALREKALLIEPDGIRSKLIIPLDQIKYTAIDGTMTTQEDIDAALEGQTPYRLDELVVDSEKFGGRTHIAAVARETLQEAEAFANAHSFAPVAFVAIPEPFTFQREVFFGPTDIARSIVGPDAIIAGDDLPVMVLGTRIKSRLLMMDLPREPEEALFKDDLAALLAGKDNKADEPDEAASNATALLENEAQKRVADTADLPALVDRIPAEYYAPVSAAVVAAPDIGPLIPANPIFATHARFDPIIAEYLPPEPATPKPLLVALSRAGKNVAPKKAPVVATPATDGAQTPAEQVDPVAPAANRTRPPAPAPQRRFLALIAAGLVAGAAIVGGAIWSRQDTSEVAVPPATQQADTAAVVEDMLASVVETPATEQTSNPGPTIPAFEIVGFGVGVLATDAAPTMTSVTPPELLALPTIPATAVADAPIGAVQPPPEAPVDQTALAEVGAPVLRGQVLSPDEAAAIHAATGVWQRAPRFFDIPSGTIPFNFLPPSETTAPSRVAQPQNPQVVELETDLSFIAPADPPAPDVVFPRDEDGFILATEEGTVTPEGAIVYAGLPDLAISLRPELSQSDLDRMALLAPAPEGVIVIAGPPAIVPPLRPADADLQQNTPSVDADEAVDAAVASTVTDTDAPTPGGVSLGNLELQNSGSIALDPTIVEENDATIDLRPRLRPQGLAPAEDDGTPDITDIIAGIESDDATLRFDSSTSLAVVLSQRPDVRPTNFGNVVAAARARQQPQPAATVAPAPAPAAAPVVAAAPVPPQNFAPVPGGVARAATQEDAISLRQMNLIGVYGRANARRALVRLGNGQYVRVEVGSALDGGQVTAIGEEALNYVKRGRTYAIEMPPG